MKRARAEKLMDGLYRFDDGCNVFVLRRGCRGLAVDFGTGRWLAQLPALGIRRLDHVVLTHHHVDQCVGLLDAARRGFRVHAPTGEKQFLAPRQVTRFWKERRGAGCPASYSVLRRGIPGIRYDMCEAGDLFWDAMRIRFLPTPGHGPNAHSVILNWQGKQLVFCGDAAHAGATVWEPYHLEWDHWTGGGALAAWVGVKRLSQVGMDLLCPSHGPLIGERPPAILKQLLRKLMKFHESKLSICAGERDEFQPAKPFGRGAMKVLPHLFHFGTNGYMLLSDNHEALIVDPTRGGMEAMARLHIRLGRPRITAAISSHFHSDHTDAIPLLQKRHGTRAYLHPWVAEPIEDRTRYDLPWMPHTDVLADEFLPEDGTWQWNEYRFRVAPFPGQTWWHAAYAVEIDGVNVFFGGDNFQPASRWNGTGGYCSYNGSRFREGFVRSARLLLDWAPDLICNGHKTFFKFRPSRFRKIRKWALAAEKAVAALCPSGNLDKDYYMHDFGNPIPYPVPQEGGNDESARGSAG